MRDEDNKVRTGVQRFHSDGQGANWSGWNLVGGKGVNSPAGAAFGTGKVVCVIMGETNKLTSVVGP